MLDKLLELWYNGNTGRWGRGRRAEKALSQRESLFLGILPVEESANLDLGRVGYYEVADDARVPSCFGIVLDVGDLSAVFKAVSF